MIKYLIVLLLISLNLQAKIKVMEVDTGISLSHDEINKYIDLRRVEDENYTDFHGHGTHVAGLITKDLCPQVELISCKYTNGKNVTYFNSTINCFKRAIKEKVNIINYSSGGRFSSEEELEVIIDLAVHNIKLVVSAGNNHDDLLISDYYPAKYKVSNIIVVGNLTENRSINPTSNYGLKGMVWEIGTNIFSTLPYGKYGYMTGTSMATAIRTNRILRKMCNELGR